MDKNGYTYPVLMDKGGKLVSKYLLGPVQLTAFPFVHLINLFKREERQHPNAFEHIGICDIAPVLVKIKR